MDQAKPAAGDISALLTRLKKLTAEMDPRLYRDIEAAWMRFCLLGDARLAGKLDRPAEVPAQKNLAMADLAAALARMKAACGDNAEVVEIVRLIEKL